MDELPAELQPKQENYFYKKHSDHAGFNAPPELQAVLDSQKKQQQDGSAAPEATNASAPSEQPDVVINSPDQ
jgi:hypothetical protein